VLTESDWLPTVIGNVAWQAATGRSNLGDIIRTAAASATRAPFPGSGFDSLQTTLTFVKRKDPLVFLGTLSHSFNFSTRRDGVVITPGDANGFSLQSILAVTPDVSLSSAFVVSVAGDTAVGGRKIGGSGQTVSLLQLGGSFTLSDSVLLVITAGAGLTQATPDFLFGVALPIRF
jgi:hypothetical protein